MQRILLLVCAVMVMGGLSACNSNSNQLIGTWNLNQPNPQVAGQSTVDCVFTKMVFTSVHAESFAGDRSGGPVMVTYTVEGPVVFTSSGGGNVSYTIVSNDQMYWSAPYGRCYYSRG